MKNYIIIGCVSLLIGGVIGYFIKKCDTKPVITEATKMIYKDTCVGLNLIADVSTQTTTTQEHTIKKGKIIKEESTAPIVEVQKDDTLTTTTFSKTWDYGLCRFTITNEVKSRGAATGKFKLEYQLDTTILKEMTTVVNTVVVSDDKQDSVATENTVYIPVETQSKPLTYVGIGSSLSGSLKADLGLILDNSKNNFGVFVDPTKATDIEGYRIQYQRKLFKISK